MSEIIKVGMADLKTCVSPDGVTTLELGSCVGIAIRDPVTKIGGLAHIMLPDSTTIRNSSQNIAKFADTGIDELVRQMEKLGAKKSENGCQDCWRSYYVHVSGEKRHDAGGGP